MNELILYIPEDISKERVNNLISKLNGLLGLIPHRQQEITETKSFIPFWDEITFDFYKKSSAEESLQQISSHVFSILSALLYVAKEQHNSDADMLLRRVSSIAKIDLDFNVQTNIVPYITWLLNVSSMQGYLSIEDGITKFKAADDDALLNIRDHSVRRNVFSIKY